MKKNKLIPSLFPIFSVALLLVSLGAAFGVLSGRGPLIGMLSTCVLVLVTALVGGTKYGVSSPTGPMTAAIAVIFASEYGSVDLLGMTLISAAVIMFVLRSFNIHKLVEWVPNLVIAGFVNGIAVLILLSQAQSIAGLGNWVLLFVTFVLSMAGHHFRDKFRHPIAEMLTSSFLVIVVMTLFVHLSGMNVETIDLQGLKLAEAMQLHVPQFILDDLWIVIPLAFELCIIAILDTLLTGLIMEKESKKKTEYKRELTGQSLAMFITGWFGGIPGAQSTVPSMMFYKEGAHHKYAKILLALATILISLLLLPLLEFVPTAVFAGVIFKIALDVADFTSIRHSKPVQLLMLVGTMLSTVFISLNLAVIGFTLVFISWNHWAPKKLQMPDLSNKAMEGLIDEI